MHTETVTYHELAARRGIKLDSARRLVRERRWQRLTGNDGTVRIIVPIEHLAVPQEPPKEPPRDDPQEHPAVLLARIAGLDALLTSISADRDHWRAQAQALATRKTWWPWQRAVVANQ